MEIRASASSAILQTRRQGVWRYGSIRQVLVTAHYASRGRLKMRNCPGAGRHGALRRICVLAQVVVHAQGHEQFAQHVAGHPGGSRVVQAVRFSQREARSRECNQLVGGHVHQPGGGWVQCDLSGVGHISRAAMYLGIKKLDIKVLAGWPTPPDPGNTARAAPSVSQKISDFMR